MKKTLLIIGIVLLTAGGLCFGAGGFFHWMYGSVMDGSASLYRRLYRLRSVFLLIGTGLSVSGAVALAARYFIKTER